ncbi:hypothetical protein DFH06DRAFT_1140312 [Mycena polygramma]|nr:hypothetical protein DFH06DRAFT_1140312 [Mycena polygramma]
MHTDPKSKLIWACHPVRARSQAGSWIFKINSGKWSRQATPLLLGPSVHTDPKSKPNWAYQQANTQFEPDRRPEVGFSKSTAGVGTAAQQMVSTGNSTAAGAICAHGPKIQTNMGLPPSSSQIAGRKLDFQNQQRVWAPRLSKWSRQATPLLLGPSVHTDPKSKLIWAYQQANTQFEPDCRPEVGFSKSTAGATPLLLGPSVHTDPKSKLIWAYQQANTQFEPDCRPEVGFSKSTAGVGTAAQQMVSTGNSTAAGAICAHGPKIQTNMGLPPSSSQIAGRKLDFQNQQRVWAPRLSKWSRQATPLLLGPSVHTDPKSKLIWAYQQANTQFEPDCRPEVGFSKSTAGVGTAAQQMVSTGNSTAAGAICAHGPKIQTNMGLPPSSSQIEGRKLDFQNQQRQMVSTGNSTAAGAICAHGPKIQTNMGLPPSSSQIAGRKLDFQNQQRVWAPRLSKWSRQATPLLLGPSVHTDPKSKPNWAYQQANTQFEPDRRPEVGFLKSTAGVGTTAQQMVSTGNSTAAEAIRAHGPKIQTNMGLPPSSSQIAGRKLDF